MGSCVRRHRPFFGGSYIGGSYIDRREDRRIELMIISVVYS